VEKRNFPWLLIVIALMGFLFQAFATQRGIGVSNDSVGFIWAARNLDRGHGIVWEDGRGAFTPVVLWPPLYPSLLAAIGFSGVDPLDAARWLNGVWFAGIILVAGATLYAYSGRNAWLAGFGAVLILVSPVMILIHAMAWSDPQALFFGFLGIYLLARYLDNFKRPYLLASAVSVGLAFLSRYPGAAFIGAACLGLCFLGQRRWARRISDAILFGAISCLGTALWLVRNVHAGGSSTGRAVSVHPVTEKPFGPILYVLSRWLVPDSRPELTLWHDPVRMANLLLVAAGLALACFLALRRKTVSVPEENAPGRLRFLPHLLIGYVICYGLVLAVSLSFLDASTVPDSRILSPLYAAFLLLSLCAMNWLLPALKGRKALATAVVLMCVAFGLFYSISALRWAGRAARQGEGFQSRAWQTSEIIGEIKKLPPEAAIYTNNPLPVYIVAGRVSCKVPDKFNLITMKPNERYSAEIAEMSERLEKHGGVFAYFKGEDLASHPSEDEIKAALPGALVLQEPDGRIYRLESRLGEARTTKDE
jgi:4-amino-4-deoxy-L-arabinose transferase-like glycosyltransferase